MSQGILILKNLNDFEITDKGAVVPKFRNASIWPAVTGKTYV